MSSNDASTVRCMRSVSGSIGRWKPGRSASTSCQSSPFATPKMRRRVVCGLSETIATFPPASAFTSVDLPTFGRPATATKPDLHPGSPSVSGSSSAGVVGDELAVGRAEVDLRDAGTRQPLAAAAARRRGDPDRRESPGR